MKGLRCLLCSRSVFSCCILLLLVYCSCFIYSSIRGQGVLWLALHLWNVSARSAHEILYVLWMVYWLYLNNSMEGNDITDKWQCRWYWVGNLVRLDANAFVKWKLLLFDCVKAMAKHLTRFIFSMCSCFVKFFLIIKLLYFRQCFDVDLNDAVFISNVNRLSRLQIQRCHQLHVVHGWMQIYKDYKDYTSNLISLNL